MLQCCTVVLCNCMRCPVVLHNMGALDGCKLHLCSASDDITVMLGTCALKHAVISIVTSY